MTLYRTIVADPPWPYPSITVGTPTGKSQNVTRDKDAAILGKGRKRPLPYRSMSLEQIMALPLSDIADPAGSRMFLWTTSRYLRVAFDILDTWAFSYLQTIVWHKKNPSPFSGTVACQAAEFLLVAQKGKIKTPSKARSSVLSTGVPNHHSRKPDVFMDFVETVSPGPYLEMFSRRARLGWDTWGDEALGGMELTA